MFEIMQNRKVLFGSGAAAETGSILKDVSAKKLFILTYSAQSTSNLVKISEQAGAEAFVCDIVQGEPDLDIVDRLASMMKEQKSEAVLAVGGGSVLDAAKAAAMIATNGGTAEDYQMKGKAISCPTLPVIMIPTTAGTGSEATKTSVLRNAHIKKSIYSPYMVAETVILDPDFTLALPSSLTASTGIDALSHAVESYVSLNANVYTRMHSLKAIELIGKSLITAVSDNKNTEARADMLYASYFAGCALHAGIGLAHIIAQPIGGMFNVPHGEACSIFLPYSMEFNLEYCPEAYQNIGKALGVKTPETSNAVEGAKLAIEKVKEIIAAVNTPTSLKPYIEDSVSCSDETFLDETVSTVIQATGHIKCNPRPIDSEAIKHVLSLSLQA